MKVQAYIVRILTCIGGDRALLKIVERYFRAMSTKGYAYATV
ncbi:hypothetical protein [Nostoc sp. T09]|nr:hypothetical protein [Nostoc sp. T09]